MTQQQTERTIWLPVTIMTVSTLMLVAAIISFIMRAPGTGDAFLAIMGVFCVAALAGSIASRNRAHARQNEDSLSADGR
jgi:hypothetical protein